jgi:hypothetical protein
MLDDAPGKVPGRIAVGLLGAVHLTVRSITMLQGMPSCGLSRSVAIDGLVHLLHFR